MTTASNIPYQAPEQERNCEKCHGFIGIPGKIYGYAGKWCNCWTRYNTIDASPTVEMDEDMIERMRKMVNDYDRKKALDSRPPQLSNEERIKNCKYVHISGSGQCNKCGGVHELVKINPEMKEFVDKIERNLTKKSGEE